MQMNLSIMSNGSATGMCGFYCFAIICLLHRSRSNTWEPLAHLLPECKDMVDKVDAEYEAMRIKKVKGFENKHEFMTTHYQFLFNTDVARVFPFPTAASLANSRPPKRSGSNVAGPSASSFHDEPKAVHTQ